MPPHKCDQGDNIKEMKEDIKSLFQLSLSPRVQTLIITGVLSLFALYAGMYVYATETFAEKATVEKAEKKVERIQENIQNTMQQILQEVRK